MWRNLIRRGVASLREAPSLSRVLQVGLIGVPNAGKSELVNRLIGHKVTAVSSKKNTTVSCHLGAYMSDEKTQIVLNDLPGVLIPDDIIYEGQKERVESAWTTAANCDVVTFIVDAALIVEKLLPRGNIVAPDPNAIKSMPVFKLAARLNELRKEKEVSEIVLALNKIDLINRQHRERLLNVEDMFKEECDFDRTFFLSAIKGDGMRELKLYFNTVAKDGDLVLPEGSSTDKTYGELAVEMVREKLYRRLNQELPYRLETKLVKEDVAQSGALRFDIQVLVPRESTKKLVIGRKGSIINSYIKTKAQMDLEHIFKKRVVLSVNVKAKS